MSISVFDLSECQVCHRDFPLQYVGAWRKYDSICKECTELVAKLTDRRKIMDFVEASLKEQINWLEPLHGGLAIILREDYPEKVGGVFVAREAMDRTSRTSRVGVVLKISDHIPYWNGTIDDDAIERKRHLKPGDRIVFDSPTPILCGKSVMVNLKGEWPIQMIHVSDIQQKWHGPCRWDGNAELEELLKEQCEKWNRCTGANHMLPLVQDGFPDGEGFVKTDEIPST